MIEKKDIFRKIGGIISELNDQYNFLSDNPENLNDLELELFVANSNFLSDHIEILRKLNQTVATTATEPAKKEPQAEVKKQEQAISQPKVEPVLEEKQPEPEIEKKELIEQIEQPQPEIQTEEESDVEEPGQEDPLTKFNLEEEPEEEVAPEEKTQEPAIVQANESKQPKPEPSAEENEVKQTEPVIEKPEPVESKQPEPEVAQPERQPEPEVPKQREEELFKPIVHEVVIEQKTVSIDIPAPVEEEKKPQPEAVAPLSLNDRISAQQEAQKNQGGSSFNRPQPVSDLKSIINLNDKLLFIKDLFNGYSLAYSEAIELVNRYSSFESAENFLNTNYAVKNNWSSKQATVDKFYEILNRRFAK